MRFRKWRATAAPIPTNKTGTRGPEPLDEDAATGMAFLETLFSVM